MNKSKIKGTAYETAVVRHLNDNGFPYAERRALAGNLDKGDIAGIPSVVMEWLHGRGGHREAQRRRSGGRGHRQATQPRRGSQLRRAGT
jgi:hypothetical protein